MVASSGNAVRPRATSKGTPRAGKAEVAGIARVGARTRLSVQLTTYSVSCGFPSPAEDHLDKALDFNELLVRNPAATFAVRIAGESMVGAGLFPGDIAVVDRSVRPKSGNVVLAVVDGEFTIKRYRVRGGRIFLQAENPAFRDIAVRDDASFEVWGVVGHAIRVL